jgi:hypothetical protein
MTYATFWTSSAIRINVVVTRNASKKRKSLEELDHDEEDENLPLNQRTSQSENENQHVFKML